MLWPLYGGGLGPGPWREPILERWNEINLYQLTRGINRFKGLAIALEEINRLYTPIPGVEALERFVKNAKALSTNAIAVAAREESDPAGKRCLEKALAWSKAVNDAIAELPDVWKVPFPGVSEGLRAAYQIADVALLSSANREAVETEWTEHGLICFTDIALAQDCGSKQHCIAEMLKFGYAPDHVLIVGDSMGDYLAAEKCGVLFYPILVRHEEASWREFREVALKKLEDGDYKDYQEEKYLAFLRNLGG